MGIGGPALPWREVLEPKVEEGSLAPSLALAGGRVKTWKRRWFILTDSCLYYFEFTTVSLMPPCPSPQTLSRFSLSSPL